jgi:hypothetical protein
MSEEQLRKLISEGLQDGISTDGEFEMEEFDGIPMSDVDMSIEKKGIFSAMDG